MKNFLRTLAEYLEFRVFIFAISTAIKCAPRDKHGEEFIAFISGWASRAILRELRQ